MPRAALVLLVVAGCAADPSRAPVPPTRCPDKLTTRGGLALTFDDDYVDDWFGAMPVFAAAGARATFFVSNTGDLTPVQWDELGQLAAAGHEIAAHSEHHGEVVSYCGSNKHCSHQDVQRYVADEIEPNIADLTAHGMAPDDFAFPGGSFTPEVVDALKIRFAHLRITSNEPSPRMIDAAAAYVPADRDPTVIGAIGIDARRDHTDDAFTPALERAYCQDETLVVYGHHIAPDAPGEAPITSDARIQFLVEEAQIHGLTLRTIDEL